MSNQAPNDVVNFVGGTYVAPGSGAYLELHEPATGAVCGRVADSDAEDIGRAVECAKSSFIEWTGWSANARSACLLKLAELIEENVERLAEAESRDTGKPISLAKTIDIPRSAANFRFFATAVLHTQGEMYEFDGGGGGVGGGGAPVAQGGVHALNYTLRRARGVAGLISPWNLPLYLLSWKIAPALATGNTVVAKPSEVTPLTGYLLGDLANRAGIPAGVLNIVQGRGQTAGAAIVTHADVPTISFTGSTPVGKWIAKEAGERLKRVSLELGGKNPFVVFADADLDDAVATAARAGFTNQGQICLCGSRLLVQDGIYTEFVSRLVERVRELKIGDPMDPATQQGALVSRAHLEKVDSCVQLARRLGGRMLCGGGPVATASLPERCKGGYFYQPTLIEGLAPDCQVEHEEIFGPVVTLRRFKTDEEALALANGTGYGLAASVFTKDLSRAHAIAAGVQAGIVWVNCWMVRDLRTPFGGMKASGVGREGGLEAIKFFSEPKNVCVRV